MVQAQNRQYLVNGASYVIRVDTFIHVHVLSSGGIGTCGLTRCDKVGMVRKGMEIF